MELTGTDERLRTFIAIIFIVMSCRSYSSEERIKEEEESGEVEEES